MISRVNSPLQNKKKPREKNTKLFNSLQSAPSQFHSTLDEQRQYNFDHHNRRGDFQASPFRRNIRNIHRPSPSFWPAVIVVDFLSDTHAQLRLFANRQRKKGNSIRWRFFSVHLRLKKVQVEVEIKMSLLLIKLHFVFTLFTFYSFKARTSQLEIFNLFFFLFLFSRFTSCFSIHSMILGFFLATNNFFFSSRLFFAIVFPPHTSFSVSSQLSFCAPQRNGTAKKLFHKFPQ